MSKFKRGAKEEEALKELLTYNCTLVKLPDDFKTWLKEAYKSDKQWT